MLIEEKLRPLGIVAQHEDGETIELGKVDPLLALKFRTAVVPDSAVQGVTTIFRPLFLPPVWMLAVLGMLALNGWLLFVHGISQGLRSTIYHPALMLMLISGVVLATAFHEIGHATATRYGGAKPGVMGIGIYIVWPAFYTDITDAYRLGKGGRLRADLGGMYFNVIFALLTGAIYAATSFQPLLLLIVLQDFAIVQQALPFLRLDGYYILSDLTGVPDIFLRIRPVLSSFIPGRPADERVTELKKWVRIVVSGYVVLMVIAMLVIVLTMVINLPRMVATGFDSVAVHYHAVGPDISHGQTLRGVLAAVEMLFLILPGAGLAYTAVRVLRRTGTGAVTWSSGRPGRQAALGLTAAAAVALAAFSWWPNGEYRPIQPGEKGTLTGFVTQLKALPTGRPSLTVQRQRQLRGAPTELQLQQHRQVAPTKPGPHARLSQGRGTSTTPASTTPVTTTTPTTTTPTTTTTTTTTSTTPTTSTTASTPTTTATTTTPTTPTVTTPTVTSPTP